MSDRSGARQEGLAGRGTAADWPKRVEVGTLRLMRTGRERGAVCNHGDGPSFDGTLDITDMTADVTTRSIITCPKCGLSAEEEMPMDACQFFYECTGCGEFLRPNAGDCCVFCSFGTVPCPPVQMAKSCCD